MHKGSVRTWHLSKHISQSPKNLPAQSCWQEGVLLKEVSPHSWGHSWNKHAQILKQREKVTHQFLNCS